MRKLSLPSQIVATTRDTALTIRDLTLTKWLPFACLLVVSVLSSGIGQGCGGKRAQKNMLPPPTTVALPPPPQPEPTPQAQLRAVQIGEASWYGPGFHGKVTSEGEIYDQNKLTAAHRTLPEGTQVKVTNLDNGKAVQVRVNDRGPYVKGRVIDVSRGAAKALEMTEEGTTQVKVEVLSSPKQSQNREKKGSKQKSKKRNRPRRAY